MKNSKSVKPTAPRYYLYCMNFDCNASIYNGNVEVEKPLTVKNLAATHACKCCRMPMVSAIDIEIKNAFIDMVSRGANRHDYHDN